MSKIISLEVLCRAKRYVTSHEIIQWGVENFCNGADRLKRKLVEQGKLRRLSREEAVLRGHKKEAVYEYIAY